MGEKKLRFQVYTHRTDYNYEGRNDHIDQSRKRKKDNDNVPPFRYSMMTHYNKAKKASLLQKCHRTFLDCVDYKMSPFDQVMKAFDFYSQIYCQKFEEG